MPIKKNSIERERGGEREREQERERERRTSTDNAAKKVVAAEKIATTIKAKPLPLVLLRKPQAPPAAATGYQGTAKKPSSSVASSAGRDLASVSATTSSYFRPPTVSNGVHAEVTAQKPGSSLTARKTNLVSKAVFGNAFVDGTKRKRRIGLESSMVDPTKDKRHFNKLRFCNLAAKKSRDKAEGAPDPSKVTNQLFPISKGPENPKNTARTSSISSEGDVSPVAVAVPIVVNTATTTPTEESSSGTMKKKRKTVRFLADDDDDDDLFISEPLQIEPANELPERMEEYGAEPANKRPRISGEARDAAVTSQGATKKLSLTDYHSRTPASAVFKKRVVFGPSNSSQVDVHFTGFPRDLTQHGLPGSWARMS